MRRRPRESVADEALIRSLFEEHGRALLSYATRLLNDRQAAEDVVQETMVRAWRNPDVLVNGKGSVRGWLLTVARNLAIDRLRGAGAHTAPLSEAVSEQQPDPDHADTVVNAMVVSSALQHLSVEHRDVLVELYFRGSNVAETASTLGIPEGTVRSRSYYALRMLRQQLSGGAILNGASS